MLVLSLLAVVTVFLLLFLAGYFTQGGELAPRPSGFPRLAFFPGATRGALAYPPSSCESQEVPPASKSQPGDPPEPLVGNLGGLEWWWWWSWWVVVVMVLGVAVVVVVGGCAGGVEGVVVVWDPPGGLAVHRSPI